MKIKPREIIYNIFLVKRFRIILLLLVSVSLPILIPITVIQFIIIRYARGLKLNTEIFFYPLCLIVGAAVISTLFILYVLIKEKRRAWIIAFLVMVVLPWLFTYSISFGDIFVVRWMIVLAAPFYLYCYLLKRTIGEWIEEYEGQELYKERKREETRRKMKEERWN
ncbi:MAG: hypothetical protein HND39_02130 [Ignavibacteriota bacterium]|jgi:hypothetical protein|nr:MAG: hypothetical protein EDM72_05025 [Chlorobiota bacterium]MBE7477228.1 hypothetical protein [Ignavibacteriales bacterium]MBL1122613.1 hypothetical protein [Ignavibacteriota bacterium]MBV6419077.1 hypothetical protein [Ignavibacteriaceae bacterium]MCE7856307.1 hypothetical protein [Ignavibacteria bacterium CHB3]